MRILILALAVAFLTVAAWMLTYPSAGDPKNLRYVFWKAGVYKLDPDVATETMIGDSARDRIVVGKSEVQLKDLFGYLWLLPRHPPTCEVVLRIRPGRIATCSSYGRVPGWWS